MANQLGNRVKMSVSGTPGTGAITLDVAVTGFQSFSAAGITSGTVPYVLEDGSAWELGIGTISNSGATLTRTTVVESSNSDAAITASASTIVMLSPLASDLQIGTAIQAYDGDLDAIAALSGTSGLLKKTAANTWTLDTSAYLTAITSGDVTTALTFTPENTANKGVNNGYAGLDGSGKVPSSQLPSYVDDVVEYANLAGFPATGSTGIIYVALDNNKIYRWSGSAYVEISPSPGSTDSVTEGSTNLYYTDARARAAVSATGSLSYNSSTGVFSFTDAVTSVAGKTGVVTLTAADVGITIGTNVQAWDADLDTWATKTAPSGTVVGTTDTQTLSGKTLTGLKETKVAMAANDIDLSLGNVFTKTISGATTFTVSNVPSSGTVGEFTLELTNPGTSVTWWSGVKWVGGTQPTWTGTGTDILVFYTHDGGTTWRGFAAGKDSK